MKNQPTMKTTDITVRAIAETLLLSVTKSMPTTARIAPKSLTAVLLKGERLAVAAAEFAVVAFCFVAIMFYLLYL